MRYERFIEGVAMAEKIRILRNEYTQNANAEALNRLNSLVKAFAPAGIPNGKTAAGMVNELQEVLNK